MWTNAHEIFEKGGPCDKEKSFFLLFGNDLILVWIQEDYFSFTYDLQYEIALLYYCSLGVSTIMPTI